MILRSSLKSADLSPVNFRPADDPNPAAAGAEQGPRATPNGTLSLAEATAGQLLEVTEVAGDDELAHRLRASGLWLGTRVELVVRAPFGDPLLFKLHGFRLALRRSEAERVRAAVVESGV